MKSSCERKTRSDVCALYPGKGANHRQTDLEGVSVEGSVQVGASSPLDCEGEELGLVIRQVVLVPNDVGRPVPSSIKSMTAS
jgi:hypothetical protein